MEKLETGRQSSTEYNLNFKAKICICNLITGAEVNLKQKSLIKGLTVVALNNINVKSLTVEIIFTLFKIFENSSIFCRLLDVQKLIYFT